MHECQLSANCRLRNLITQGLMIQPDGTVAYEMLRRPMMFSRLAFILSFIIFLISSG